MIKITNLLEKLEEERKKVEERVRGIINKI
jgi:hypothetical protein